MITIPYYFEDEDGEWTLLSVENSFPNNPNETLCSAEYTNGAGELKSLTREELYNLTK